jgi:hypothetical protein
VTALPLLEKRPLSELPAEQQRWIDPDQPVPWRVSYYASYWPMPPLLHGCGIILFAALATLFVCMLGSMVVFGTFKLGYAVVMLVAAPLFYGVAAALAWLAARVIARRRSLAQGRIRPGYYVGETAFLDYDGSHVWLVPRDAITAVLDRPNTGRNGSEDAVLYLRDAVSVRHRVEGTRNLVAGLSSWYRTSRPPSQHGWERGAHTSR